MNRDETRFSSDKISLKEKPPVEIDPTQRFQRSDDILHFSDSSILYKAYDRESGSEVTWHELMISNFTEKQKNDLIDKAKRLKTLRCPFINSLLHFWQNTESTKLYYITESVWTNSIFKNITENFGEIRSKVIARWFMPVLEAINYLHTQDPPITHNKIMLSSMFIKPTTGSVKIIPPVLFINKSINSSVMIKLRPNTPPDFLFKQEGPYSDIWSFGLALLFVFTRIEPYAECKSPLDLVTKLSKYEPPQSLQSITDQLASNLISSCLKPPQERPTAAQLLKHPFFTQNFDLNSNISNAQDDSFVVIFSGKPKQSNSCTNVSAKTDKSKEYINLPDSSKVGNSSQRIGKK